MAVKTKISIDLRSQHINSLATVLSALLLQSDVSFSLETSVWRWAGILNTAS